MDEDVEKYLAEIRDAKTVDDKDIYEADYLEEQTDDDTIQVWEEGWMRGYLELDSL
ncbi:MAG TPA: hypothetical protein VJI46_01955 [Candidatus Nanoarchaeia archaeon]|nr:hypothetical protein [Candidatus Nanoarchaeia archaeon]